MGGFARSARLLVGDLAGTLLFAVLLALGVAVLPAVLAGIALAAGLVAFNVVRGQPVGAMQSLSLALLVLSGVATFVTDDPRYVMAKPTIVCLIVAAVMLKPGWLGRYLPSDLAELTPDLTKAFGFIWAGLLFATGLLNLAFVFWWRDYWLAFLAVFPAASKALLFGFQVWITMRVTARRKGAGEAQSLQIAAAAE